MSTSSCSYLQFVSEIFPGPHDDRAGFCRSPLDLATHWNVCRTRASYTQHTAAKQESGRSETERAAAFRLRHTPLLLFSLHSDIGDMMMLSRAAATTILSAALLLFVVAWIRTRVHAEHIAFDIRFDPMEEKRNLQTDGGQTEPTTASIATPSPGPVAVPTSPSPGPVFTAETTSPTATVCPSENEAADTCLFAVSQTTFDDCLACVGAIDISNVTFSTCDSLGSFICDALDGCNDECGTCADEVQDAFVCGFNVGLDRNSNPAFAACDVTCNTSVPTAPTPTAPIPTTTAPVTQTSLPTMAPTADGGGLAPVGTYPSCYICDGDPDQSVNNDNILSFDDSEAPCGPAEQAGYNGQIAEDTCRLFQILATAQCGCKVCFDLPGWEDTDGKTCEYYRTNDVCNNAEEFANAQGVTASEACCACDGGTGDGETAPPVPPPIVLPPTPPTVNRGIPTSAPVSVEESSSSIGGIVGGVVAGVVVVVLIVVAVVVTKRRSDGGGGGKSSGGDGQSGPSYLNEQQSHTNESQQQTYVSESQQQTNTSGSQQYSHQSHQMHQSPDPSAYERGGQQFPDSAASNQQQSYTGGTIETEQEAVPVMAEAVLVDQPRPTGGPDFKDQAREAVHGPISTPPPQLAGPTKDSVVSDTSDPTVGTSSTARRQQLEP